jgi:hypothetical protein
MGFEKLFLEISSLAYFSFSEFLCQNYKKNTIFQNPLQLTLKNETFKERQVLFFKENYP